MRHRLIPIAVVVVLTSPGAARPRAAADAPQFVAHEWGTFTSIAGEDGRAVDWLPLSATPDLPCFINRLPAVYKWQIRGLVRMETPVLYFYSPTNLRLEVDVHFHQGYVTEWFPRASVAPENVNPADLLRKDFASRITWSGVTVTPGADPGLVDDHSRSHYYVARQTAAAPLAAGGDHEKFLFYRGVGGFDPPLTATLSRDGTLVVRNPSGEAIGDVIRFERRGDSVGYEVRRGSGSRAMFESLTLEGESATPEEELRQVLVSHGLYPKEAAAMVETWRDSWFEPGSRLFYIAPRQAIDAIIPLKITPAPSSVVRVFVGRIELGDRSSMPKRMQVGAAPPAIEPPSCR